MWFKQAKIFQLAKNFKTSAAELDDKISPLTFTACLPSLPQSVGFLPPVGEIEAEDPLVRDVGGNLMLCVQFEEKILPATVINQHVAARVKEIEHNEDRRVRQKEKLSIKDDITVTLMPRAFTKFSKVYAYIDTHNNWLVINTTSAAKYEKLMTLLQKAFHDDLDLKSFIIEEIAPKITRSLVQDDFPTAFEVQKKAVFQDPNQENRIIRCQHQDLYAESMVALIKDGCRVKQLSLTWQDQVSFAITDESTFLSISYEDELLESAKDIDSETKEQVFDANMMIMTKSLSHLIHNLTSFLTIGEMEEVRELEEAV